MTAREPGPPARAVEIRHGTGHASIERFAESATVHIDITVTRRGPRGGGDVRLVDAVFSQPELADVDRVRASVPLGDVEMLWRVERFLDDVVTRATGSTCLLEGTVRPVPPERRER